MALPSYYGKRPKQLKGTTSTSNDFVPQGMPDPILEPAVESAPVVETPEELVGPPESLASPVARELTAEDLPAESFDPKLSIGPDMRAMVTNPKAPSREYIAKLESVTAEEKELMQMEQVNRTSADLPLWADIPLMAGIYGATGMALTAATGSPVGVVRTTLIAAPTYSAVKTLLTGRRQRSAMSEFLPGSEDVIDPRAMGMVGETAEWMALPAALGTLKGAGRIVKWAGKKTGATALAKDTVLPAVGVGIRGLANGVEKVVKKVIPHGEPLDKAAQWTWNNMFVKPMNVELPVVKKSLAQAFQPAVERLEKKLPAAAKLFRQNAIEKAGIQEAGTNLGKRLAAETPEVTLAVKKALQEKMIVDKIANPRAKEIIRLFNEEAKEVILNKKYEQHVKKHIAKLFPKQKKIDLMNKSSEDALGVLTDLENSSTKQIHKALGKIIKDGEVDEGVKELAKDIWNMSAKTPLEVMRASRSASDEFLVGALKEMKGVISPVLKKGYTVSKHPSLKGAIIHKDVELELRSLRLVPKITETLYNRFFLTPWKTSKVILRPASHMRNQISNIILNDWGGLPFWRADVYGRALVGMRKNTTNWKDFQKLTGVRSTTHMQAELGQMSGNLAHGANMFEKAMHWHNKIVSKPRALYNAEEAMYKYAKFLHNLENGMGKVNAAADAIKWTFNFGEVTPEMAMVSQVAMPFARWFSKVIPLGLETAVKHPLRFGKWGAFGYGLHTMAMENVKLTEHEWNSIKKDLPDYMNKGMYMMMPWRDDKGRLNMLDMTYTLPFIGDVSELLQRSPIEIIGQNPIFTMGAAFLKNEKFSGAPIYQEWEEPNTKYAKVMQYAWEQLMPAIAPGGTDWNRIYKAVNEKGDLSVEQAVAAASGFKLTPIDPLANARRKRAVRRIHKSEVKRTMRKEIKESKSGQETSEIIEQYRNLLKQVHAE